MDGERSSLFSRGRILARAAAGLVLVGVCWAGAAAVASAVRAPDLEWRLLAMVALVFSLSPFSVHITATRFRAGVFLPLSHPVLFASSIALGPAHAALPGAFSGIARLLFAPSTTRPVYQTLCSILKPAAVCSFTSLAYLAAGGSIWRPHESDSLLAVLAAAAAYLGLSIIIAGAQEELDPSAEKSEVQPRLLWLSWTACFVCGYAISALYATAPTYVLLAPALVVALARTATGRTDTVHEDCTSTNDTREDTVEPASDINFEFTDPTTGLANERYLAMFVQRNLNRAQRKNEPLALAIFDIDDKGKIASTETLDAALAEVGRRMKAQLRDYDLVARHSAGRIVVVLPETDAQDALEVIQRLHRSLDALEVGSEAASISAGVAIFPQHGANFDELIKSAHHALNCGRATGGSGVHVCSTLAEAS